MAIIRIKRSTGTSAPGSLKTAELGYTMGFGTQANGGDRLYFGKGDDGTGNATTIIAIGGEYFTNMLDHVAGSLTASSALIVDADSKVDNLKVDNIDLNGNTISTTDTNGTLTLNPNGSGTVDVSTSKITSVVDPTADQDAATKLYVDTVAAAKTLTIGADTGSNDDVNLSTGRLDIFGGTGLETVVTNDTITINTSATTIGDTAVDLGGSITDLTGLTSLQVDNITINGNTIQSTDGSNTLYLDPAPTDSDGGDLIIRGNLTVQGTTTTINSTEISVNDLNLTLADGAGNAADADGAGITIDGADATILYDAATDRWDLNKPLELEDSIGASIFFNGTSITEAIEDHLVNNVLISGEGLDITYDDGLNKITFAAELATLTNPGVASFGGWADSDQTIRQFSVTSGNVRLEHIDGGDY